MFFKDLRGSQLMKLILGLLSVVILTTSCVKKRPDIDAQAADLDKLLSVSDVKSWSHTLTTGEKLNQGYVTNAETLIVDEDLNAEYNIKFPTVASFQTDSPFLKGNEDSIVFFGEPKSSYKLIYQLTSKYLKISKSVNLSKLNHYERPYAKIVGDSAIIPLGGYRATYYNIHKVRKSDDNKDSNINQKFHVHSDDFESASYVKIDKISFKPFTRVPKKDVLPTSYFTKGKWYYAGSVVDTKIGDEGDIGFVYGSIDSSNKLATKIRFIPYNGIVAGVNIVKDKREIFDEKKANFFLIFL
jgi:hypothetical protein